MITHTPTGSDVKITMGVVSGVDLVTYIAPDSAPTTSEMRIYLNGSGTPVSTGTKAVSAAITTGKYEIKWTPASALTVGDAGFFEVDVTVSGITRTWVGRFVIIPASAPTAAQITTDVAAQITTDHGGGSYVRNTEPDNASIALVLEDTGTTLPASIAAIAASMAAGAEIVQPVLADGTLILIEGRTYDGTLMPLIPWTVAKDYSGYSSVTLKVWRPVSGSTPSTLLSAAAVVASSTSITVDTTATFDSAIVYDGCPPFEKVRYSLIGVLAGESEEIAKGDCYVLQSV